MQGPNLSGSTGLRLVTDQGHIIFVVLVIAFHLYHHAWDAT
jgi:hypothetical protein